VPKKKVEQEERKKKGKEEKRKRKNGDHDLGLLRPSSSKQPSAASNTVKLIEKLCEARMRLV
jgi:hypothetical protein